MAAASEGDLGSQRDKTRLCPSCRMEISVLATKCRFCGEEVGRPRLETRSLTVKDLGGEHVEHYSPSSSVMEALEAFRTEETVHKASEPEGEASIFKRRGYVEPGAPAPPDESGLPRLDEMSRALSDLSGRQNNTPLPVPHRKYKGPGVPGWVIAVGCVILAFALFAGGGYYVYGALYPKVQATKTDTRNPALDILASGDLVNALEAALKYDRRYKSSESAQVVKDIRAKTLEGIQVLLDTEPYDRKNLSAALSMINQAIRIDPNTEMTTLKTEVANDVRDYGIMVQRIDYVEGAPSAVFRIGKSDLTTEDVTVKEGDTLLDGRFEVMRISRTCVRFKDTQRGGRHLKADVLNEIGPE